MMRSDPQHRDGSPPATIVVDEVRPAAGWLDRVNPWFALGMLALLAYLLQYNAWWCSPTIDEPAHFAAGAAQWKWGRQDVYRVNPPLVKTIAAIPLFFFDDAWPKKPPPAHQDGRQRIEFPYGDEFFQQIGAARYRILLYAGRWAVIPFAILGGLVCWRWSSELFGAAGGMISLALYATCPMILGHGCLITPDVPAAATTALACYATWRWHRSPTWVGAALAGLALGLALLTKFTALLLIPALPMAALAKPASGSRWRCNSR